MKRICGKKVKVKRGYAVNDVINQTVTVDECYFYNAAGS